MLISNYSIHHRTTILVILAIIVLTGLSAYMTLPRESAPDIEFPMIMVTGNYEGASPSDIESLVTYPIERKLKNLTDVKKMESTSSEGMSLINLEFEPEVDIDTALQKVRDKVDEAAQDLPDDMQDDPIIKELSATEEWPVMFVNISGDVGLVRLKDIAEDMEDDFEAVQGVLGATILGGLEREIRVEFDLDRVSAYGLTMAEIIMTVARNNQNTPGGSIDVGEGKYNLKVPAEFGSAAEIENLVVAVRGGKPIYLSDIAIPRDTFKDRDSFARVNGSESVTIKITKRAGEHLLRIADDLKAIIATYRERLPEGITITITMDSSKDIHTMVSDLENNILTGLILVLVIIFLSLGLRNAILVASAIPFSMLMAFTIIQALGITLNMVVLFSLILALGMLVDNAIVIVENIYRHHVSEAKPIMKAAMEGTSEVAWPVIASTATTVAAFAPLVFWPGIMGQFMSYLPKTVIIVLLSSLFVAMLITPVLASMFIRRPRNWKKGDTQERKRPSLIIRLYAWLLAFGLRYRVLGLLFFFSLLVVVIFAYTQSGLGVELFPDTEPKFINVSIETPEGTNIFRTNDFALQAEEIIGKYGNIESVTVSATKQARINIVMVDREFRVSEEDARARANLAGEVFDEKIYFQNSNDTMKALRKELTAQIVGAEVIVDKMEEGPPVGPPVNVEIGGDDYQVLAGLAAELKSDIRDLPGIVDLTDNYKTGLPEVNVRVDKERAAILGLDAYMIGQLVKAAVNGIKIGDLREGEDEYDITARLPENQRESLQDVLRLQVPALDGTPVPLTSVARVETSSGLSGITHIDLKRIVAVTANVAKGFNSQQVLERVQAIVEEGRLRLRSEDLVDPAGLVEDIQNGSGYYAERIRGEMGEASSRTLAMLDVHKAGEPLADPLLSGLLLALNKVQDGSGPGSKTFKQLIGLEEDSAEEASIRLALNGQSGYALARSNRALMNKAFPGRFASQGSPMALPPGYGVNYTGENEDKEESATFLTNSFVIAVLLISLILVTQFNSIFTPFIILVSIILSFIGVFLGLILTSTPFGIIMTGMGVISLAGVVVNNAIVLIDYTNVLRRKGRSCHDAILEAGCTRFRPVILTAVTTILGMLPMAVQISYNFRKLRFEYGSEMSQWWGSLATAVIFGLIVSTALTLFVVPNLYSLLFDREEGK